MKVHGVKFYNDNLRHFENNSFRRISKSSTLYQNRMVRWVGLVWESIITHFLGHERRAVVFDCAKGSFDKIKGGNMTYTYTLKECQTINRVIRNSRLFVRAEKMTYKKKYVCMVEGEESVFFSVKKCGRRKWQQLIVFLCPKISSSI